MGDWLYMSAFETSLAERSLPILDILTRVTRKMTEGELLQLTLIGNAEVTEEQYLDVLRRKTAYLFSASCEIGGILGCADENQQGALREYGLKLGTAFQLIDDVLDFTANEEVLGKAAGADLLGGKVTLPLIYLLEADRSMYDIVQRVLRNGEYAQNDKQEIQAGLSGTGALERARALADDYAVAASAALECLPGSPYCESLRALPSYVLDRER
jgi:octaprenyl-diphosphate synthase